MKVQILTPTEWQILADEAHKLCFAEENPVRAESISFALLVLDEDNKPCVYMTCRESDEETVYMQYGGAFPGTRDTIKSYRGYEAMLHTLALKYKRATTLIENTNKPMLKFAMKAGLLISGVRFFKGSILLEHYIEWSQ